MCVKYAILTRVEVSPELERGDAVLSRTRRELEVAQTSHFLIWAYALEDIQHFETLPKGTRSSVNVTNSGEDDASWCDEGC